MSVNKKLVRQLSLLIALFTMISTMYSNCGPALKSNSEARDLAAVNSDLTTGFHNEGLKLSREAYVQPLYMNRVLVTNLLNDFFGPANAPDYSRDIAGAAADFGMSFSIYEVSFQTNQKCAAHSSPYYTCNQNEMDMKSEPIIGASAPREARRMSACQKGVDNNVSLAYAFGRIQSGTNIFNPPAHNLQNYQRLFALFFRGRALPEETFFDNFAIISNREPDKIEAWKKIILSVCYSPHWQVL